MADKKISELDVIGALNNPGDLPLTGSNPIFPLVQGGNTLQINASALAVYTSQWSATTASFNTFVSTQNAVNLGIAIVTGSFNQFTASLDATYATDAQLFQLYQATASIHSATASINTSITSLNSFSSSIQTEVGNIEAYTASLKSSAIVSSSQQILNYNIFVTTSSLNTYTSSQNLVNLGISIVTGSLNSQTGSQNSVNLGISEVTSSLNSYTSSNESWKDGVRGEVNGLEAYTASLKGAIEVSGQDVNVLGMITAQQFNVTYVSSSTLYQSGSTKFGDTSDDRHEFTGSVDISDSLVVQSGASGSFSGSFTGNGAGLTQVPSASIASDLYKPTGTISVGIGGDSNIIQISGSLIQLGNPTLYTETLVSRQLAVSGGITVHNTLGNGFATIGVDNAGSAQIGANNNLNILLKNDGRSILYNGVEVSASISVQNDVEAVNLIGSLLSTNGVVSSSNQLFELNQQTGSQDLVNLGISTFTGSIREEVNGIEAYTASLKGQAIVSSSTQITNYHKFAETASANTFYGNQTISGSLNVSSSVNLSGSVVINQLTYPTLNFADGQYGVEVPTLGVNNVFSMEVPKTVYEYVKNDSGITLPKGTPVHSTGTVGFNTLVIAASASVASTMPATFILAQDLDDEEEGLGIAIGSIQGVNTTGLTAGRPVYVGANGGWTQSKPTGSNLIQNLGIVTKVGVNGGGVVLGAGRSNDVPNIQQGYFWAGNSGSVATPFPTSSFELSGRGVVSSSQQIQNYSTFALTASANTFYGEQTITGSLLVSGSVIPRLNFSQAILTGSQTIAATSYDLIHLQNEFDPNGWWNPDAHSFNPTIAGYYNVVLNVWYNTNSYGNIRIRKNTNVVAEFQSTDNGVDQDFTIGGSKIIYLDGNLDYLDFDAYNQSASPADIEGNADGTKTWFTITLLGN